MATAKTKTETPATTEMVTLSRADLAAMIAEALQARDEDEPTGPPPGMELAKAIGDAVALGMNAANPQKVKYGAYLKRPTKEHPLGIMGPKLSRSYVLNGRHIEYSSVDDTQINLLNAITHSGRYIDRRVEVIVRDEGGDAQSVEIRYPSKKIDDRMENKNFFRNFTDLCQKVVDEQTAERLDEEENPRRVVRRPFGSSKTTLAAEAAAST